MAKYAETGTNYSHSVEYGYDTKNNLSTLEETINGTTREIGYSYDADNRLEAITNANNTIVYTYDDFGRVEKQEVKNGEETVLTTIYTYQNRSATLTSTRVKSIQHIADNYSITYTYTYDGNGNILSISDGTNAITYEYDERNQLIRENDPIAGTTREFLYKDGGQLDTECRTAYTDQPINWAQSSLISYTGDREWGDMLTAVNGQSITRDAIGNMLSYNGYTYTWEHGRELATLADSTGTWAFTYDANGMRTKKVKTNTAGTVTDTYAYVYNGSQLSQMTKNGEVLNFFYDGEGRPSYFTYNNAAYYYVTNLQGDVTAILDSTGTMVVNYHYDAYGVLLQIGGAMATSLGTLNPLTYRGYVYDHETGLYYLQSRYYNPSIRRFISPDAFASTGQGYMGYNMFAYCLNNPINYVDPTGMLAYPGEIHNEVVRRIAEKYGYSKEQIIFYEGGGFGRADLISSDGQVWDVKRDKPRQIKAGKKQVAKYAENIWAKSPDTPLSVGGNEIESGSFYHKSGLTTYKVTYRYAGDGVIAYDYSVSDFDYQTLANTVLVVSFAAVLGMAAGLSSGVLALFALA